MSHKTNPVASTVSRVWRGRDTITVIVSASRTTRIQIIHQDQIYNIDLIEHILWWAGWLRLRSICWVSNNEFQPNQCIYWSEQGATLCAYNRSVLVWSRLFPTPMTALLKWTRLCVHTFGLSMNKRYWFPLPHTVSTCPRARGSVQMGNRQKVLASSPLIKYRPARTRGSIRSGTDQKVLLCSVLIKYQTAPMRDFIWSGTEQKELVFSPLKKYQPARTGTGFLSSHQVSTCPHARCF